MEFYTFSLIFLPIVFTIIFLSNLLSKSKLPPGPKPWPIIGNIHMLGEKPHHTLTEFAKTYGPIMSLKLGSITTIVISSPEIAKEMFVKHDLAISSRSVPDGARARDHDRLSMVWLPVSAKWRELRKIATMQLFSNQQLNIGQALRQKKLEELVDYARKCCENGVPMDIGKAAFTTTLNLLSSTFFSKDLASHDSSSSQEFKDIASNIMEEGAKPNLSDFFPIVKSLDLQGILKRSTGYVTQLMELFERIIDERSTDEKDDVLGTLLKLAKDDKLSLEEVKHMLVDLFVAGTDTTSNSLEWAMALLIRHPEKIAKAQSEMDEVLGKDGKMQESDIAKLPYVQSILKEVMRLYPPAPFLIPHKAEQDVPLGGYLVPKNSTIWVNVYSIGHDPRVWQDPEIFSPERFLETNVDFKGQDFELLPFGSGRRICPGIPLAHRMVQMMLGVLLHSFNWKYAHGTNPKDIDMEEKFGIALQKAEPLQAIPLPR